MSENHYFVTVNDRKNTKPWKSFYTLYVTDYTYCIIVDTSGSLILILLFNIFILKTPLNNIWFGVSSIIDAILLL